MPRAPQRDLPRFAPVAPATLSADDGELLFVPDMRLDPASPTGLSAAPGAALPGRLSPRAADESAARGAARARAFRPDGELLDVVVVPALARGAGSGHATDERRDADARESATGPGFPGAVFVYGTLMCGEERAAAIASLLPGVRPEQGSVAGGLQHLGAWPGLVTVAGRVEGELFATSDVPALLRVLDPIEDFAGYAATPTEYVRVVLPVTTPRGRRWAWCYLYVGPREGTVPIPNGRWRDAPRRVAVRIVR